MTPQLYINYKLQSVEHMPARTLTYRFLNTIIDDLFSFIITMPMMHRISCFRDDIIFVVYLYQRYKYSVDKTRGMYATERKEPKAKAVEEKEKEIEAITEATTEITSTEVDASEDQIEEQNLESKKTR